MEKTQSQQIAEAMQRDGIRWQNRHLPLLSPSDLSMLEGDADGRAALAGQLDLGQASIDVLASDCIEAMIALRPASEELLRSTSVHLSFDDTVTASSFRSPDGSAAALINHGLFSYLLHLGTLAAALAVPRPSDRRYTDDPHGERRSDVRAAAATLRYYFVHERVWGLAGKLPASGTRIESLAGMGPVAAMSFAICHELAHLALGHGTDPASGADPRAEELEADLLALEATRRSLLPAYRLRRKRRSEHGAILGAALVSLALASVEFHLALRDASSHPSAASRWEALSTHQLAGRAGAGPLRSANGLLAPLGTALEYATRLTPLPVEWWNDLESVSWLSSDALDPEYLSIIRNLDAISLADAEPALLEPLRSAVTLGTDLDTLLGSSAPDHLEVLGVDAWSTERILDPTISLSRAGLVSALAGGTAISSAAEADGGITAAVVAARFVEAALRKKGLVR
jgi:hypothetical protein